MFSVSRSIRLSRFLMVLSCLLLSLAGFGATAHAQTWDLARDFSTTSNPNGAWTYGAYGSGGTFTAFAEEATNSTVDWPFWIGEGTGIGLNTTGSPGYGIGPGQVTLEADTGTP